MGKKRNFKHQKKIPQLKLHTNIFRLSSYNFSLSFKHHVFFRLFFGELKWNIKYWKPRDEIYIQKWLVVYLHFAALKNIYETALFFIDNNRFLQDQHDISIYFFHHILLYYNKCLSNNRKNINKWKTSSYSCKTTLFSFSIFFRTEKKKKFKKEKQEEIGWVSGQK